MAITLDQTGSGGVAATTGTLDVTTTADNEIIILAVTSTPYWNGVAQDSSVSGGELAWTKYVSLPINYTGFPGSLGVVDVWYAIATTPVSGAAITITVPGGTHGYPSLIYSYASYAGILPDAPFDSNASLPATATVTSLSALNVAVSTTGAAGVLIGVFGGFDQPSALSTDISPAGTTTVVSQTLTTVLSSLSQIVASPAYSSQQSGTIVGLVSPGETAYSGLIVFALCAITAPGVPQSLVAIAETTTTIKVGWTIPSTGGTPASYTLQYRQTGTTPWTQITGITAINQTVTGLTSATEYDFQVEAVNSIGVSGFTATTTAWTLVIPALLFAGVADLFFAATSGFVDLSLTANRRLFITSAAQAPNLGADGSGALGVSPAVFLTVTGGGMPATADTFAANNGSGGPFTEANGPLTFAPVNPPGATATAPPSSNMVGDFQNGNIYAFNLDEQTDNGAQRKWLRTWRATQQATMQPQRFDNLVVDIETGIDVPDGTAPQLMLRWSDDGGHNWSNTMIRAAGPVGATSQRVMFKRLGSTRRGTGLDRIFELSCTDPFKVAIIRAEFNV
jgi:hypothetical protein